VRNFVRLMPGDDELAAAQAVLARQLGLHNVYVLDDGSGFWKTEVTKPFQHAARRLGLRVVGSESYNPGMHDQSAIAEKVAQSGAEAVVIGGDPFNGADHVLRALRERLGRRVTILGNFWFIPVPAVLRFVGPAARGTYFATSDLSRANAPLTAAGQQFAQNMGPPAKQYLGVLEAGQATELVLNAIAHSDGTRASVLKALRTSRVHNDILGSFGFDANGDPTTAPIPIVRITGTRRPGAGLPGQFEGSVLDRMVDVPAALVR
jgi:branched-chain amino acid transport system substrate-binding protein